MRCPAVWPKTEGQPSTIGNKQRIGARTQMIGNQHRRTTGMHRSQRIDVIMPHSRNIGRQIKDCGSTLFGGKNAACLERQVQPVERIINNECADTARMSSRRRKAPIC